MREIKFRVWDKQYKEILGVREIGFKQSGGIEFVILIKPKQINERGDIGFEFPKRYIGDDDIEIMQYTGLKDKKGNEIYEGDILEFEVEEQKYTTGVVRWEKDFSLWVFGYGITTPVPEDLCTAETGYKVIGNKYENPELLGEYNECSR